MRKCVTDKKAYTCHSSIEILSDAYSRQLQQTLKPLNPVVSQVPEDENFDIVIYVIKYYTHLYS